MNVHQFTSESYSEHYSTAAWQDVLGGFGLRSSPMSATTWRHATAMLRGSLDGVGLVRFTACAGFFASAAAGGSADLVVPAEDGGV